MVESYLARLGARRASWKSIQEMKKNMQKVPVIQKKSDMYHKYEQEQIDGILDLVDHQENDIPIVQEYEGKSIPRRKQLLKTRGFISDK